MRTCMIAVALVLAAIAVRADAQSGQPHVDVTVTGPTFVYPGSDASFDVTVDVDGPVSDFYITWRATDPFSDQPCCDHVASSVVSGQASAAGDPAQSSIRWSIYGPRAVIRLVLHIKESLQSGSVIIGGYLPGTNVAQYETVSPWKALVGSFPQTGGPPATTGVTFPGLIMVGLAAFLLSAVCFGAAMPRRRSS